MTDWLVDTLLATSLLMALVLLIREPVRRHFGPAVAYGLWLIPAARLLMPTLTTTVERTLPAAQAAPVPLQATSTPQMLVMPAVEPGLIEQLGGWDAVALAVWIAGAVALMVRGARIYRAQRHAVLGDGATVARLDGIRIIRSSAVTGPMAFGVFDRVIVLPIDFDERYDAHQRRLTLDHELSHHRSGDIVANHFAFVLLCLQWFNPLAWASHAAFRFDQEAACDARVLDKVSGRDRAAYGQAIAKAASGRALLFAGALDRPGTLQRRLSSMLSKTTSGRRLTGKALIALTATAALPLTATWATLYVDIPAPSAPAAPAAPLAPLAPAAMVAPTPPVAPLAPVAPVAPVAPKGKVMINGVEKDWKDLTPAEREEIRRELAEARAELAKVKIPDMAAIRAEVARDLAEARIDVAQAMREIDANAVEIRRAGLQPEALKAQVQAALASVQSIDIEAITSQALASVDRAAIAASLAAAEASIEQVEDQVEQVEEQNEVDDD